LLLKSQRFFGGFLSQRFLAVFWWVYAKNYPKFAGIGANQFKGTF